MSDNAMSGCQHRLLVCNRPGPRLGLQGPQRSTAPIIRFAAQGSLMSDGSSHRRVQRFRFLPTDSIYCSMNTEPVPMRNTATDAIERWLAIQVTGAANSDVQHALTSLQMHTPSQRVVALYDVLGNSRDLALRTSRLPVLEQLRLSLDLLRAGTPVSPHTRAVAPAMSAEHCGARRRGRPRAR